MRETSFITVRTHNGDYSNPATNINIVSNNRRRIRRNTDDINVVTIIRDVHADAFVPPSPGVAWPSTGDRILQRKVSGKRFTVIDDGDDDNDRSSSSESWRYVILRPGQVLNWHLSPTLKMCTDIILQWIFWRPRYINPPPHTTRLWSSSSYTQAFSSYAQFRTLRRVVISARTFWRGRSPFSSKYTSLFLVMPVFVKNEKDPITVSAKIYFCKYTMGTMYNICLYTLLSS